MNSAVMVVNAEPGYPFHSAAAALNTYFADYLQRSDYSVRVIGVQQPNIPLNALDILEDAHAAGPVDLAVYCDLSHWLEPLKVVHAKRTLVFFHGLVGTPLVWMTKHFDALCCNSQWTVDVLRSIGGYPLWEDGQILCPDIYRRSFRLRCPLPALEHPGGGITGDALPDEFFESLEEDSAAVGLDSFWEADDQTHAQIIAAINEVARERGDTRVFRLLVQRGKLERLERWLNGGQSNEQEMLRGRLNALGLGLADILRPLPTVRVRQSDLFRLMRLSRFALMFNKIPESFGLMPLECVLNGCPVHTNGSGNLRHLLPDSHGITVHDTDTPLDSCDWASRAARSIYEHSLAGSAAASADRQAQLARGRDFIQRTYTAEAFAQDIGDVLRRGHASGDVALTDLRLAKGPLVRRWERGETQIVCDTGILTLTTCESERGIDLLGSTAADLFRASAADRKLISDLWRKGLLTWEGQ